MFKKFVLAPVLTGAMPSDARSRKEDRPTIAQLVAASGKGFDSNRADFDILLKAVSTAGLVDALNNPSGRLTVFAPNDSAFMRLARGLGYTGHGEAGTWNFLVGALTNLGGGDPIPVLTNVLLYHVHAGVLRPGDVLASKSISTLLPGASFGVRGVELIDAAKSLRNPKLDLGAIDIKASNGRIHTITRVLIPVAL
jgi:serralysin